MTPEVLALLDEFDEKFSASELTDVGVWCGSQTVEGARNNILSKLFAILNAICTPDALEAIATYRRKYDFDTVCGISQNTCQNPPPISG